MLTNEQFDEFKHEIKAIIALYKKEYSEQKPTDWKTYEKEWANRLRTALNEIKTVIDEAVKSISVTKHFGRPAKTTAEKKTLILLQKDLAQFSNRKMADLLPMFALLNDVETSYKTIERAYSNSLVRMIIHNMFIILVKRKRIVRPDITGDGTGYGLTITRHYRTVREKQAKDEKSNTCKKNPEAHASQENKHVFTYAFALMDLDSRMYVGYGASLKSEKAAFEKAVDMMREGGVDAKSVRLDKYYGIQSTATLFGKNTVLYVIPRRNTTINGPYAWKDAIREFMHYPFLFLKEYFRREHSESAFSADKRCNGWKICQRRDDRIETATMFKGVWHNLLWLGG